MRQVIAELAYRHAEDASFLWLLRDRALLAPHYSVVDLTKLDRRLDAQLAAMRLDPELAWRIANRMVKRRDSGSVFVGTTLSIESGKQDRISKVLDIACAKPANARAFVSALGWLPASVAMERVRAWFRSENPILRRIAIAAGSIQREPMPGELERGLGDADPGVRARALKAVGELGTGQQTPAFRRGCQDSDPMCRLHACWSALRISQDQKALDEIQNLVQAGIPSAVEGARVALRMKAADIAVRRMASNHVHRWLDVVMMLPGGERVATVARGRHGDPAAIPKLLDAMKTPALARIAGEAFTFITGVDLDAEELGGQQPEGFEAGPNDDPADENVAMDEDENLPWPDLAKLTAWWEKNRSRFANGQRLLLGKPITPDWCREVLRIGKQRQRAAAALELALREPNKPLFEVRAPGFRQ